jgi:iron complex transport system substrate-binding protein
VRIKILIVLIFISSCKGRNTPLQRASSDFSDYAECFRIERHDGYSRIRVFNPWQKAENIEFSYILSALPAGVPDSLASLPFIRIPVRRVIAMSTTHIGFISALDEVRSIVGISGSDYISDQKVRNSVREGNCLDVGYFPNLDYESIISLKPDVVFLYGLENTVLNVSERLKEAGIPSVIVSEFLENHPLGKAEWIRFFAAFYDAADKGDNIIHAVKNQYLILMDSVHSAGRRPLVLSGLPWKDTWYLPGGHSFSARFIQDAGGEYLWKDDLSEEFIALDLESVFLRAMKADIWINSGTAESKSELLNRDERFLRIRAFRSDSVFNNNARLSPGGGNDFWESGTVHPEIILRDLIEIFHPGLLSRHKLYYYRKLE